MTPCLSFCVALDARCRLRQRALPSCFAWITLVTAMALFLPHFPGMPCLSWSHGYCCLPPRYLAAPLSRLSAMPALPHHVSLSCTYYSSRSRPHAIITVWSLCFPRAPTLELLALHATSFYPVVAPIPPPWSFPSLSLSRAYLSPSACRCIRYRVRKGRFAFPTLFAPLRHFAGPAAIQLRANLDG